MGSVDHRESMKILQKAHAFAVILHSFGHDPSSAKAWHPAIDSDYSTKN
jgi:hypothetical protein